MDDLNKTLHVDKFEGLLVRQVLAKDKLTGVTLCFTVEHHSEKSLGGYQIIEGKAEYTYFSLAEAVDKYNIIIKKKISSMPCGKPGMAWRN